MYIVDQNRTPVYAQTYLVVHGKKWDMNKASRHAHAECNDGNAPKTSGEFVKAVVYPFEPNSLSMRKRPPGDPGMP